MTSPAMPAIRVNQERAKQVSLEWERASYSELSAYCLRILREIGCPDTELPENLRSRDQQLNFITGFASYAFGEVLNVQSVN
ncbi:hypothetical protein A6770_07775 [Nostoc minutum NIES-26]|uniref:Uncharacterized protein n=1 Tax=Nostoc minutum NIES-26 TaxID=1844469 RepID=A0A367S1N2_9NOSO|nr:hypothetical protein A6770_07775 [Nostoc minutum NIES-26]